MGKVRLLKRRDIRRILESEERGRWLITERRISVGSVSILVLARRGRGSLVANKMATQMRSKEILDDGRQA